MDIIEFTDNLHSGSYIARITDMTEINNKIVVKFAPFDSDAEYDEVTLWIAPKISRRSAEYRFFQVLGFTGRHANVDDLFKFVGTTIGITIVVKKTPDKVYNNIVNFFDPNDYDPDDAPDSDDPEEYDSDDESELDDSDDDDSDRESELDDSDDDDSDSDYALEELVEEDSDDEPEEPPVRNHKSSSKKKKKGQNRRRVEC